MKAEEGRPGSARRRWRATAAPGAVAALLLAACSDPEPVRLAAVVEKTVKAGPSKNSDDYRAPSAPDAYRLGGTVLQLLAGGEEAPVPEGASLVGAVDGAGRPVVVVADDPAAGTTAGLGAYAVAPGAGAPPQLVIEVPHPRADLSTEVLGTELFSSLEADALLVAGAHRTAGAGAADVAHEPASAFAAVDRAIVGPGTVVVQVHGFDESRYRGDAEVVLSSAQSTPAPLVEELGEAFEDAGIDTCVYDGKRCEALAGTTNVQAAHARAVGATFVHLELSAGLRKDPDRRQELVEVLQDVLGP